MFALVASPASLPTVAAAAISNANWENILNRKRTNVANVIQAVRAVLDRTLMNAELAQANSLFYKLEFVTQDVRMDFIQIFQVNVQIYTTVLKILAKNLSNFVKMRFDSKKF